MTDFSLAALDPGEQAVVLSLRDRGDIRRRLQDLGLIPGTPVSCLARSPLGDPCAYQIRGAVVALRREDALLVEVAP